MKRDFYRALERARRRLGRDTFIAPAPTGARIRAYRVTGGAVVDVVRLDGRERRYRVPCSRFLALRARFNALNWCGSYMRATLDVTCNGRTQR